MQGVKALVLVLLVAGAPACQRGESPADVMLGGQLHEFTPDVFHNAFAATTVPVLRVSSGDSIHTTTIDAAGTDEKGVRRAEAGNPQTGPFYIEGAEPGDTIAIHVTRLRLNRDWAISTDTLSNVATTPELAARTNGRGQLVRWHLDLQRGIAMREDASPNLARYAVAGAAARSVTSCARAAACARGLAVMGGANRGTERHGIQLGCSNFPATLERTAQQA